MFYNLMSPYFLSTFLNMILFVQDGRIKVGDRIVAVEDQPVAGLSVDEVQPAGGVVCSSRSSGFNDYDLSFLRAFRCSA